MWVFFFWGGVCVLSSGCFFVGSFYPSSGTASAHGAIGCWIDPSWRTH